MMTSIKKNRTSMQFKYIPFGEVFATGDDVLCMRIYRTVGGQNAVVLLEGTLIAVEDTRIVEYVNGSFVETLEA